MDAVFLKLLNMSITAGWLILAVIILRFLLKKAPKWISCMLWSLVAIRLICPISIESALSLIPSSEPLPASILSDPSFRIPAEMPSPEEPVHENTGSHYKEAYSVPSDNGNPLMTALSAIWISGTVLLILYSLFSYFRLSRRTRASIRVTDTILKCDAIDTPFVLGIIQPHIYLPSSLDESQIEYVVAHEKAHIRRLDHWWKPIGYLLLSVYWFHPLCWAAYILLCRDIEMACDESVVRSMDLKHKKCYAEALLSCSIRQKIITACPLAFGEVRTKERIQSILHYKKPAFWVILVSAAACIIVAVCFLTSPAGEEAPETGYVMPEIDAPSEVLSEAKKYTETMYLLEKSYRDYGYTNWRIEQLAYQYTYDNLGGKAYEIYQMNYEFLSSSPDQVLLVGGMSITEDGWVVPGYPNSTFLIFEKKEAGLSFICGMVENDCFPGDDLFTDDLLLKINQEETAQNEILTQLVDDWARAFINRDGTRLAELSSSELLRELQSRELLTGAEGEYSFGLSGPWPQDDSTDFQCYQYDTSGAVIYYYARTQEPRIVYWKEELHYQWDGEAYVITGEQLTFYDNISTGKAFEEAYQGRITGGMIDYTQNQLGEALNQNALLASSNTYKALFSPESAASFLLNLSTDPKDVQISRHTGDNGAFVGLDITFLRDQVTAEISMFQPFGESGIWVPADYQVDVLARFESVEWDKVEKLRFSPDRPDITGILCIGELPEHQIKVYGYNDEDVTGRGVAIEINGNVNYFDWYYTTPRLLLPDLYWDKARSQLQISFHTYTGTGFAADDLYILQHYDTGTLQPSNFNLEDYRNLVEERVGWEFHEDTKKLTFFDQETNVELASAVIPEGVVTDVYMVDISHFTLGDKITLHFTPGYCIDGGFIAQYEDMPELEYEVVMDTGEYGDISFSLKGN